MNFRADHQSEVVSLATDHSVSDVADLLEAYADATRRLGTAVAEERPESLVN
jgi:hypothetical protein